MLKALATAARSAKRYLTLTLDEVQDADLASMQTLVRLVHEGAQTDAPVLLASAGLGETYALLEALRTYVQRWSTFELRLLSAAETIEAIREPIVRARANIVDDALDFIAHEAAGYPFFIQTYASAAWEFHRGSIISMADVKETLRPLARMSPRETAFALTLADLGPGSHEIGAVARALGVTAPDISSIRATLARKNLLATPIPGRVEFRVPFTDRYLRAHREDYDGPDVAEYREALKRRLTHPRPTQQPE